MRKRITVHLNQRSEMLSGISHDLRTPLTRLKLQLAMLKQQDLAKKMGEDIEEMERMLNEYLEFSRYQKNEKTELMNISHLIRDVTKNTKKNKLNYFSKNARKLTFAQVQ
jgi:two-component system osmolarity sensor histidine kinase EnvZ